MARVLSVASVAVAVFLTGESFTGASDPHCQHGIHASDSEVCCALSCGKCGGLSCQDLPGGESACCSHAILSANHSCDTYDPPCVMPAPAPPPPPPPSHVVNPKRGWVADGKNCDDALLLNTSGWFYGYNTYNPLRQPGIPGDCAAANQSAHLDQRFAPMAWCLSGVNTSVPTYVNRTFFMGYNEPNNRHNCNTDAETVARSWAQVMDRWNSSQLVSPATSGNGIPFFDDFFANCTALYGPNGCNISYLAAHCYSCDPNSTMSYLQQLYDRYGYKVWLTEFSCGDGADARPTADHVQFMTQILPLLDQADFVYRYSWMSAVDGNGRRGLVKDDAASGQRVLTELGMIYNS